MPTPPDDTAGARSRPARPGDFVVLLLAAAALVGCSDDLRIPRTAAGLELSTRAVAPPASTRAAPSGPPVGRRPGPVAPTPSPAPSPTDAPALEADELAHLAAPDLFRYAEEMADAGRAGEAARAYEVYADRVPALSDIAWMGAGTALLDAGSPAEAAEAFARARADAGDDATAYLAALRTGNALLRAGRTDDALAAYVDAYGLAPGDDDRAQALAGQIAAHREAGRDDAAQELRYRVVRELPGTGVAGLSLARLREAGMPVAPAEAAPVAAGAGEHAEAVRLWREALPDGAGAPGAPVEWIDGLAKSLSALGRYQAVVDLMDGFLARRAGDPAAPRMAWKRAEALDKSGRDREALDAFTALADRYPAGQIAADALHRRALLLEALDGPLAGAAALDELLARHPGFEAALDARFRAGLLYWQGRQLPRAAERWTAVADGGEPPDQARAWYWLGRAAADAGADELAEGYYHSARAADPMGFYGLRAAERLGSPPPDAPPAGDGERALADWLSSWRSGFDAAAWPEARAAVAGSRPVARAVGWLALGERRRASRALRTALQDMADPVAELALAVEADRLGLHEVSISAATGVILAAPSPARGAAPRGVWRLAYPDAFGDLVRAAADEHEVPSTLLFALIRQESRFDPQARSSVGATGLSQVMPATGRGIAAALQIADFATADLQDPGVAVPFGAWYLSRQVERFDGFSWAALAAYNGGPGNAARWLKAAGGDADLFAETIDFRETRRYVRLVIEQQAQYARLYAADGPSGP